jgi:DNA ligase-1
MKFSELASYFDKIEAVTSRLTITDLLSQLFTKATEEEIGPICYLLQGRVAPLFEPIEFGVGDKLLIRAIARAYDVTDAEVLKLFKKTGDLGIAAQQLAEEEKGLRVSPAKQEKLQMFDTEKRHGDISVLEVFAALTTITSSSGMGSQDRKIDILSDLFSSGDPLASRYLARIPLGKLRLGFSDKTVIDAFSWMKTGNKSLRERLEAAYNVRPDLGYIGTTMKKEGIDGLTHIISVVGAPVLPALCQRLPGADDMIEKMGTVAVEPKYDGERVQIHIQKSTKHEARSTRSDGLNFEFRSSDLPMVRVFSRSLETITDMFPELTDHLDDIHADSVILDAEAVGYDPKTGKIIPFQQTMSRKRKHNIAETAKSVPIRFFVFDILNYNGHDLLPEALSKRREILSTVIGDDGLFCLSPQMVTSDADDIRAYHKKQIEAGLEGVVVKQAEAVYSPGRTGYTWVKLKETEGNAGKLTDTIDGVVMGYSTGEGKRTGFGIGKFLVGIRLGDQFVTVTKIGTGVTDDQWKILKKIFHDNRVTEKPHEYGNVDKTLIPDVWITPSIVVEVAGDDLTVSSIHSAGFAIRFPRLVRVREDKTPEQATTKEELHTMYTNQ